MRVKQNEPLHLLRITEDGLWLRYSILEWETNHGVPVDRVEVGAWAVELSRGGPGGELTPLEPTSGVELVGIGVDECEAAFVGTPERIDMELTTRDIIEHGMSLIAAFNKQQGDEEAPS